MTKVSAKYQHLSAGQRCLIRKKVANAAPEGRSILIRRLARQYGVKASTILAVHRDGPRRGPYAVNVSPRWKVVRR